MRGKNKWLALLLALIVPAAVAAMPPIRPDALGKAAYYGDVNEDGAVNAHDALLVLQYAVEKTTLSNQQLTAADVSGDLLMAAYADVNALDALLILRYGVARLNAFPVELMKTPPRDTLLLADLQPETAYEGVATLQFDFFPAMVRFGNVQGGYFDGSRWIVAMTHMQNNVETVRLQVLDPYGNTLALSDELPLDHANNITYHPGLDRLVVSHCQGAENASFYTYSLVDPHTMQITQTAAKEFPFFSMAYAPSVAQYASGRWGGETIDVCDAEMRLLHTFQVAQPKSLSQGVFADESGIYFVRSHTPQSGAELLVYTWQGALARRIPLDFYDGMEPESINIVNGQVYVMCDSGGYGHCYLITFRPVNA